MNDAANLSLSFAPLLPFGWLVLLGLLLAAALGYCLYRRVRGTAFRAAFSITLLGILANPQLTQTEYEPQRGIGVIVLDDSASQAVTGRTALLEEATEMLTGALPPSTPLDWRVERLSTLLDGRKTTGTALAAGVDAALRDVPAGQLAAVIAVSDGQVEDAERLSPPGDGQTPLHLLVTGPKDFKDRRLVLESEPAFGLVGRPQSMRLRVEDIGAKAAVPAQLTWRLNDGSATSRTVLPGESVEIGFTLSHRGENILDIQVDEWQGEATLRNNRATLAINGVRDRLRVVLVSGEPYQGERLWRQTLKSDPSVDLVHFTILRLPTSRDVTPVNELSLIPFPTRELFEKNLSKFDLVIFDRYSMRGVLQTRYLANLANYVMEGGALLVAVGPEYGKQLSLYTTPLGNVLPVAPQGQLIDAPFRPQVTATGMRHPVTAGLISGGQGRPARWGAWHRLSAGQVISGETVMSGALDLPLLVLDRQGEGRVAMVMSDQSWLWGRDVDGGGPHVQFVRRLVHWLMREPDLEEEALRANVAGDTIEITRQSLSGDISPVTLESPLGATQTIELKPSGAGLYSATIKTQEAGLYRLSDGQHMRLVAVGVDQRAEISNLQPTEALLADKIGATGGGIHWLEDGPVSLRLAGSDERRAGPGWFGVRDRREGIIKSITAKPLLPAWLWLVLLSGCLLGAWLREAR